MYAYVWRQESERSCMRVSGDRKVSGHVCVYETIKSDWSSDAFSSGSTRIHDRSLSCLQTHAYMTAHFPVSKHTHT
jgi:hypothetical protein